MTGKENRIFYNGHGTKYYYIFFLTKAIDRYKTAFFSLHLNNTKSIIHSLNIKINNLLFNE